MAKAKNAVWTAAYGAGTLVVLILLVLTAAGPNFVLFPDAMLPVELRELALAWMAIGFLPMLMASSRFYQIVRRKAVFLPAAACLIALLFWIGAWTVGMFRSPAMASDGDIVLPEMEDIDSVHFSGSELDLTIGGDAFIRQFLDRLGQAENTGKASVQDVPTQAGAGLIRVDLNFQNGGASTVFLYRDNGGLMAEQPYQGIFRADDSLEIWLREQFALEMARGVNQ